MGANGGLLSCTMADQMPPQAGKPGHWGVRLFPGKAVAGEEAEADL